MYDRDLKCRGCKDGVEVDPTTIGVDVELDEGRSADKRRRGCACSACLALLSIERAKWSDHVSKMSIDEIEHAKAYLVASARYLVAKQSSYR